MGEKLGHTEIKKAQQADEFAQMMVERCTRAGASKDKRASKFMVIDGALYRVTGSGDPQEGGESQRIYVPLELRKALMRNYHSTVWAKHQHSRSMHKQMVAWYQQPSVATQSSAPPAPRAPPPLLVKKRALAGGPGLRWKKTIKPFSCCPARTAVGSE